MPIQKWPFEARRIFQAPSEVASVWHLCQGSHAVATDVLHERRPGHGETIHQARAANEPAASLAAPLRAREALRGPPGALQG